MTAQAISVFWWVFGALGVGGLIALWFLAPAVASTVLRAVAGFFKWVLSYRIGCALVAAVIAALVADHLRHRYDDEQFAQRTAAFEAAQKARDARIAAETRDRVYKELEAEAAHNRAVDNEVKVFTDAPPTPVPAGNPLRISDGDADRLCRIAGQTECRSVGGERVPETRRTGGRSKDQGVRLPNLIRSGARPNQ